MSKLLYYAHPIDHRGSWHPPTIEGLLPNWTVFRPWQAYHVTDGVPSGKINVINETALREADLLLAVLPEEVATVGTAMEIALAQHYEVPVVVVTDRHWVSLDRPGIHSFPEFSTAIDTINKWMEHNENMQSFMQNIIIMGSPPPND
jgi:hypothetical protein